MTAETKKFSTFQGVFTPTIMTIIGVVIFMRANFVVGHAGIYGALVILCVAKLITTLTTLSISAVATNTDVKGGGAYYLISRSIGPEFGAALGLTIFISQALIIPFYLIGFTEALVTIAPVLREYYAVIAYAAFAVTAVLAFNSTSFVLKTQIVVMVIIALSLIVMIGGALFNFSWETFAANAMPYNDETVRSGYAEVVMSGGAAVGPLSFWVLFAIYFPAVTGIMAGLNMSGDLQNPTKAIPRGTITAIFVAFVVYAAQMILCGGAIPRVDLILRPYDSLAGLWSLVSVIFIAAGVLAATLSSAFATVLGAPRVLQSLAQDKILKPVNMFAKVTQQGEPRRALVLTLLVGLAVIYFSVGGGGGGESLNIVASVVSMFFLLTYGIINYAAFVESFSRNPSFRPRFKLFHWSLALVGAVASFGATLLINVPAALIAGVIFAAIFFYVRKYVMSASFGDARRGFIYSRTRDNLLSLTTLPAHAKNWRPTAVVFAGGPDRRQNLIKYADWLSSSRGILTIAALVKGSFAEMVDKRSQIVDSFNDFLTKNNIKAFPEVLVTPDFDTGVSLFLQAHSIGPIKPNMAIFGWSLDPTRAAAFVGGIRTAVSLDMNVTLICGKDLPAQNERRKDRVIDIWWRGMRNGSLMVILAHLLSLNSEWSGARIRILRVVTHSDDAAGARAELERIAEAARMDLDIEVIRSSDNFSDLFRRVSGNSTVIFMGFRVDTFADPAVFQENYTKLMHEMPTTILVQSTGDADLLS